MSSLHASKGVLATVADPRQTIDRLGFRPAALVAWWSRQDGHGVGSGNRGGIGFWTSEHCAAVAWASEDGTPDARTAHAAEPVAILGLAGASGEVAMRAQVEFGPDGVTLTWTPPPMEPWLVHFLALGGASIRSAQVGWAPSAPAAGGADLVLVAPAGGATIGIGAGDGRRRAAAGYSVAPGSAPGAVSGAQRTDASIVDLGRPVRRACYLALAGVRAKVGADVSPTRPGPRQTRVGFRPEALLLFSWGLAASRRPRGIGRLCLGGAAGPESGCVGWDDRNATAEVTATHVRSSGDDVLVVADTRTGGIHARAKLTGADDGGFTLDWSAADVVRRQFAYVALAESGSVGRVRRLAGKLLPGQRQRSASSSGT
jgi:hypothetical protein